MSHKFILNELCRYRRGTFADIIYRNALLHPEGEAFVSGQRRVTFFEFNLRVNGLIRSLKRSGVPKGGVIGILSWNCMEYPEIYGAAMKGGLIASPFNPRLHEEELEYLIRYSETETLFLGPEFVEIVERLKKSLPGLKRLFLLGGSSPAQPPIESWWKVGHSMNRM
jgi:fatty-acyl-CoA synthase